MVGIFSLVNEFQREIMLENQKEGIEIAKRNGVYKGRKKIPLPRNFDLCLQKYLRKENNYRMKQFIIETGLSRELVLDS